MKDAATRNVSVPAAEGAAGWALAGEGFNAVADGFVRLYHGGNAGLSEIKGGTGPGNIFGGIFTSQSRTSAASHGDGSLYSVDVQEDKVLSQGALDELDHGTVVDALRSAMPWLDDADFDIAYEAVVDDRADRVDGEDLTRVFREDTEGEEGKLVAEAIGRDEYEGAWEGAKHDGRPSSKRLQQPGFTITEGLRAHVSGGLPLFQRATGLVQVTGREPGRRGYYAEKSPDDERYWLVYDAADNEVVDHFDTHEQALDFIGDNIVRETLRASQPLWYSSLLRAIEQGRGAPRQAGAAGWQQWLDGAQRRGEFKVDERVWVGVDEWLATQEGPITREALADFVRANGVQVTETVLGSPDEDEVAAWWNDEGGANNETPWSELSDAERNEAADQYVDDFGRYSEGSSVTKYAKYTLPGGTNYREVLLTLPGKTSTGQNLVIEQRGRQWALIDTVESAEMDRFDTEAEAIAERDAMLAANPAALPDSVRRGAVGANAYLSRHWDQPNVLAHIRVNDRVDADGKRVLFVEEIQSDWGQEGKKKGFKQDARFRYEVFDSKTGAVVGGYDNETAAVRATQVRGDDGLYHLDYRRTDSQGDPGSKVPSAPFVDKTDKWLTLALKRVLRMAVDGGYDKVAFVTGEQSADRYDLSKQVERIEATRTMQGHYHLRAYKDEHGIVIDDVYKAEQLPNVIGKALAEKVVQRADEAADRSDLAELPEGYRVSMDRHSDPDNPFTIIPPGQIHGQPYAGRHTTEQEAKAAALARLNRENDKTISLGGLDLQVGGEGLRAFYDVIVPKAVNALLKRLGGGAMEALRIGKQGHPWGVYDATDEENEGIYSRHASRAEAEMAADKYDGGVEVRRVVDATEQPGFAITEGLRAHVSGGMPLFQRTPRSEGNAAMMLSIARWREADSAVQRMLSENTQPLREIFESVGRLRVEREALAAVMARITPVAFEGRTRGGLGRFLTASAKHTGDAWQITRFDANGEPWGDSGYTNLQTACEEFLRDCAPESVRYYGDAVFRQAEPTERVGMSVAAVARICAAHTPPGMAIRVVPELDDLPAFVRAHPHFDAKHVRAVTVGETVYFVASRMPNAAFLRRSIAHEVIGHVAFERFLGPKLDEVLIDVLAMEARGEMPDHFAHVRKLYGDVDARTFAREVVAVLAERPDAPGFVERMVRWARAFLRTLGLSLTMQERDLRAMLARSRQSLETATWRATRLHALAAACQRAFHGASAWREHGAVSSAGAVTPLPSTPVFMFAGERAQTADPAALASAKAMKDAGATFAEVWRELGWGQGVDGQWRFEITDATARWSGEPVEMGMRFGDWIAQRWQRVSDVAREVTLADLLDHPALFAAYPQLADVIVRATPVEGARYGSNLIEINADAELPDALSLLVHEVQHAVQVVEGFARGGHWAGAAHEGVASDPALRERMAMFLQIDNLARTHGVTPTQFAASAAYPVDVVERVDALTASGLWTANIEHWQREAMEPYVRYRHLAGEVEARNTQRRQAMPVEERRMKGPTETQDVAAEAQIVFQREASQPLWYSSLLRAIEQGRGAPRQASAAGWQQWLDGAQRRGEFKVDERVWVDVDEWLATQEGRITREALADFVRANGVQVTETVLGMGIAALPDGWTVEQEPKRLPTKYSQYTLPGGENYREVLLTLPSKDMPSFWEARQAEDGKWAVFNTRSGEYVSAHFRERDKAIALAMASGHDKGHYRSPYWSQSNVLAHIRVNDRVDADGKRVLFVEEIQSDWGQDGKKQGFLTPEMNAKRNALRQESDDLRGEAIELIRGGYDKMSIAQNRRYADIQRRLADIREEEPSIRLVPSAPFVTATDKWLTLSLKRVLRMAVDGGYDKVAFVTGEQSAERYDLSKRVDAIKWNEKTGEFSASKNVYTLIERSDTKASDLEGILGKELALRLIEKEPGATSGNKILSGLDIKVGGEGIKDFYDKIVPQTVSDVLKKVGGGKMERVQIANRKHDESIGDYFDEGDAVWRDKNDSPLAVTDRFNQTGFIITDVMRAKLAQPQPLFQRAVESPSPEWSLRDECVGAHNEQRDLRLTCVAGNGDVLGWVAYSVYAGEPSIQHIDVVPAYRRQGVATRLLLALQASYPDTEIQWGYVTGDGAMLYAALATEQVPNPVWIAAKADEAEARQRLQAIEAAHAGYLAGERDDAAHAIWQAATADWHAVSDALEDAQRVLLDEKPYRILLRDGNSKATMTPIHQGEMHMNNPAIEDVAEEGLRFGTRAIRFFAETYLQESGLTGSGVTVRVMTGEEPNGCPVDASLDKETRELVLNAQHFDGFGDAHAVQDAVEATVRHMVVGYFGLEILGPNGKQNVLQAVMASRSSPGLREIWDQVNAAFPGASRTERAEHVFAMCAEQSLSGWVTEAWRFVLAQFARALRAVGVVKTPLTYPETCELANLAAKAIRARPPAARAEPTRPTRQTGAFMA